MAILNIVHVHDSPADKMLVPRSPAAGICVYSDTAIWVTDLTEEIPADLAELPAAMV